MDIDTALARLYASTREEFIPTRDDLAMKARSAGDRRLSSEIAKARKPTVAAWLLNQVGREYPDDLDRLAELADELRRAHQELAGDRLRELSSRRNELLRVLEDRAYRVARRATVTVAEAVTDQLRTAFLAGLRDTEVLAAIRVGRLSSVPNVAADLGWPDFPTTATKTAPRASAPPKSTPKPKRESTPEPAPDWREQARARREQIQQRRRAELAEARQEAKQARSARNRAERELTTARRNATRADEALEAARQCLDDARAEQRAGKQAVQAAQRAFDVADRAAQAADRAVAALTVPVDTNPTESHAGRKT